jgi:hypothetical protein
MEFLAMDPSRFVGYYRIGPGTWVVINVAALSTEGSVR